jgi:hypothetical protein
MILVVRQLTVGLTVLLVITYGLLAIRLQRGKDTLSLQKSWSWIEEQNHHHSDAMMTSHVMLPAEDTFLQRDVVKVKQFLTLYSTGHTDDDWVWPCPASSPVLACRCRH